MHSKLFLFLGISALMGCSINPADYETDPIAVPTSQGDVICQLYKYNRVDLDRAIAAPAGMGIKQADAVCRERGYDIMNGVLPEPGKENGGGGLFGGGLFGGGEVVEAQEVIAPPVLEVQETIPPQDVEIIIQEEIITNGVGSQGTLAPSGN